MKQQLQQIEQPALPQQQLYRRQQWQQDVQLPKGEQAADLQTEEGLYLLAKLRPEKAFDLAVDMLAEISRTAHALVEANSVAIATMEARNDRIERLQYENRQALDRLVADADG